MKMTETLRVKKLSETATLPVRGSDGAAGYDLARYDKKDEDSLGFTRERRRRRRRRDGSDGSNAASAGDRREKF